MASKELLGETSQSWQALRLFNIYRLLIATLFLALWFSDLAPASLGQIAPQLFLFVLLGYLGLGFIAMITSDLRWPMFHLQAGFLTAGDIIAIILLAHSSGGISSGVDVLLIPAIGAAGILLPELSALFAAAAASILILSDQIFLSIHGLLADPAYTQSGLIGLALFAIAVVSAALAHRARANEALAERRGLDLANLAELNGHIIEHFNSGLIVTEPQGKIRLINAAAWRLLGHATGDLLGSLENLSPSLFSLLHKWQGEPSFLHHSLPLPGQGLDLRVRFAPLGSDRQAILITLEDQAEIAAQIQSAKLVSLGRLAASIAHEIRNPLSAITHAAQLLNESPILKAQDSRLVEIIRTQGTRIDAIINDVLRLSRKELPRVNPLNLKIWLRAQIGEIRNLINDPDAILKLQMDKTDLTTIFDEGHLTQILCTLCDNASRYGKSRIDGRLHLTIAAHRPPGSQQIRLDIIDQGTGVPPDVVEHLFEPFFTTSSSGTGLGLYIASELCTLNSGHLEYIPMPSDGSCFRCYLPAIPHAEGKT